MVAQLTGVELFGISEDEVQNLAAGLAKLIVARGGLPKAEREIERRGPGVNFLMVLAAIYGPRLLMLWKLWDADRARRKKRVLSVMPASTAADQVQEPESEKAVN